MTGRLPEDRTTRYLTALGSELISLPPQSVVKSHVTSASREAKATWAIRRSHGTRLTLLTVALATLISTSGVAMAGSLPRPVQNMVADAARLLPVPLPIPYPAAPTTLPPADPSLADLQPRLAAASDAPAAETQANSSPSDSSGTAGPEEATFVATPDDPESESHERYPADRDVSRWDDHDGDHQRDDRRSWSEADQAYRWDGDRRWDDDHERNHDDEDDDSGDWSDDHERDRDHEDDDRDRDGDRSRDQDGSGDDARDRDRDDRDESHQDSRRDRDRG